MDHVVDTRGAPHTVLPFVLPVSFDKIIIIRVRRYCLFVKTVRY